MLWLPIWLGLLEPVELLVWAFTRTAGVALWALEKVAPPSVYAWLSTTATTSISTLTLSGLFWFLLSYAVLVGGVVLLTHRTAFPDMCSRALNGVFALTAARPGWEKRVNYSLEDNPATSLAQFDPHCNPIVFLMHFNK